MVKKDLNTKSNRSEQKNTKKKDTKSRVNDTLDVEFGKADPNEVVTLPIGQLGGELKRRFDKIDGLILGIVVTLLFSVIAIIISVIGLFLDQMRYNNATYKNYTIKLEEIENDQSQLEILIEENKELKVKIDELQDDIGNLE